ncbi:ImmA/IrrE family metallo-endopeptidase [Nostocoides vanveenii]|uniref:IrrE N-terminal-like domain-containing protein n=1 Tax=Nostocoides vanveenii TaxID=330835 RepID=A0ABN2KPB6_9MICO
MTQTTTPNTANRSVLNYLRTLTPHRVCDFAEAIQLAERQAGRLANWLALPADEFVQVADLAGLARIQIAYARLPVSGMSHWTGQHWLITLNTRDSPVRQRFTALHEFKHIIDHGQVNRLYVGNRRLTSKQQAEKAADFFAGCALIPRPALKRAWGNGLQRVDDLADYFGVSRQAIEVRLDQTGLSATNDLTATSRCARPIRTARHHFQRFVEVTSRQEILTPQPVHGVVR